MELKIAPFSAYVRFLALGLLVTGGAYVGPLAWAACDPTTWMTNEFRRDPIRDPWGTPWVRTDPSLGAIRALGRARTKSAVCVRSLGPNRVEDALDDFVLTWPSAPPPTSPAERVYIHSRWLSPLAVVLAWWSWRIVRGTFLTVSCKALGILIPWGVLSTVVAALSGASVFRIEAGGPELEIWLSILSLGFVVVLALVAWDMKVRTARPAVCDDEDADSMNRDIP